MFSDWMKLQTRSTRKHVCAGIDTWSQCSSYEHRKCVVYFVGRKSKIDLTTKLSCMTLYRKVFQYYFSLKLVNHLKVNLIGMHLVRL